MESGIYVWKLNGVPKYVGRGADIKDRMFDKHYGCKILVDGISKYGYDSFEKEVVEYCELDKLAELEIFYIKELHTHVSEGGYNISWGGDAPMMGLNHSEKTKEKIRKNHVDNSGEKHPNFGKHLPEEVRKKIGENQPPHSGINSPLFGKHLSKNTRKKISKATSGKNNPNFGKHLSDKTKEKLSIALSGENCPKERREKMSKSHLGKRPSRKSRQKMSKAQSGKNNGMFGKKRKGASSKYYGVCISKSGKYVYWQANVRENKELKYIGQYKLEIDAAKAYDKYIIGHNLPNPLNFPEDYK